MKEADIKKIKALLVAKYEANLHPSRQEHTVVLQSSGGTKDIRLAGERRFSVHVPERETNTLRRLSAALIRIARGEFGICLACDEPISRKRLDAVPWAVYCLQCEELQAAHMRRPTPISCMSSGVRHVA